MCPRWWKQSFWLWLWSLVWFQVRATSCHLTTSKSAWKSITKVYLDVLKSVVIPWCNQVGRWHTLGVAGRTWHRPTSPKETQALASEGSVTALYPSLPGPLPPPTWTRWTTSFGHPPSIPLSSRRRLWKRHASSSGSVSRWWLRLKVATLNRCQLYYIIKLPELIFSIKVFKIKL